MIELKDALRDLVSLGDVAQGVVNDATAAALAAQGAAEGAESGAEAAQIAAEAARDVLANDRGRSLATAVLAKMEAFGLASDKPCAITRKDANTLLAYRPLGGKLWQEMQLTTGGIAGSPYSWNQTRIVELLAFTLSAAGTFTGAGWQDLVTQSATSYLGGRAKQNGTNGSYVEFTITVGGDLYAIFTGRTSGGYVRVDIDGDTEKANALPSNGSFRYFDAYTAADLQYRQRVKVATGLVYGQHTIRLTVTNQHNPASSGYLYVCEGLGAASRDTGLPHQTDTRAPPWKAGTVYAAYEQVQHLGRNYSTAAGGTAGATPPTHTSGSVSDGGVTWAYMTASSYELASHVIQGSGSQLEYAFNITPDGFALEDVGGIVHGNETLTALAIIADGDRVTDLAAGVWLSGDSIAIEQTITATHSVAGAVATETLRHEVSSRGVTVAHDHAWLVAAAVGWFYSAMWPLLHYGAGEFRYAFDAMWSPQGGKFLPADYYGQANPIVGRTKDYVEVAWGDVLMPKGAGGVPSAQLGPVTAVATLYVPPESVNGYAAPGSVYAGLAMNMGGTTAPGGSSVAMKLYFERAAGTSPVAVAPGDVWRCTARYLLALVPSSSIDPVSQ